MYHRSASSGNGRQAIFGIPRQRDAGRSRGAQKICAEITTKFMEQNLQAGRYHTETEDFLSQNLADAKAKLDEQGRQVAEFKKIILDRARRNPNNLGCFKD